MTEFQLAEYRAFRCSGLPDHEAYQAALAWVPDAKPAPFVPKTAEEILEHPPGKPYLWVPRKEFATYEIVDGSHGWGVQENALWYTYLRLLGHSHTEACELTLGEYDHSTVPALAYTLDRINYVLQARHGL